MFGWFKKKSPQPPMEIPGLGVVTKNTNFDWHQGLPIPVPVLGGKLCRFIVERYDEDPRKDEFHAAIANFLMIGPSVLRDAESYVFQYFQACNKYWQPGDDEFLAIESPGDVWRHVRLGSEPMVTRRAYGDEGIYVSVECGCDWDREHGLQIVFKNGHRVNKVGPYDGHVTNSDAYADDDLEEVVYRST